MKKVTKLALTLTAALGLAAVTSNKPSHASHVQPAPTQRVQPKRPALSNRANLELNQKANQVGQNHLIQGHHIKLQAQSAVAINGRTGQVVYAKNANQKRLVASTGKLMTLYLAEKKFAQHPQAWNQRIRVSQSIAQMGHNSNFDGFGFRTNRSYKLGNVFKAAFIASDDDAATLLGQWIGGTNHHFIRLMNRQARKWRLNATFTSASGLENDDLAPYGFWVRGNRYSGNRISAKSLGIIAYHLIKDYPQVMKYSRIKSTYVDGHKLRNENRLLPGGGWYRHHLYTDGLKTGYTPRAGLCFVGTGQQPNKDRLITVVLHDPSEFSDTDDLMNFVYKYSSLYNN